MREFIKCLINSNRQTLNLYGPKMHIDLEFKILKDKDEDFSDVSMQIKNFKDIPNKDTFLSKILAKRNSIPVAVAEDFEINDGNFIGQKGCSYYFFAVDNEGKGRGIFPGVILKKRYFENIYTNWTRKLFFTIQKAIRSLK